MPCKRFRIRSKIRHWFLWQQVSVGVANVQGLAEQLGQTHVTWSADAVARALSSAVLLGAAWFSLSIREFEILWEVDALPSGFPKAHRGLGADARAS
ncbi:hypothetical protein [Andreprevotia chitinilytica]|uniref:hypothetical protein n=1 Tax=Andreprevotia chitinilytica TaxID=396808 RepID=UPI000551133B|nr:hypothetical protein [Andreprevotia chitinilytica]